MDKLEALKEDYYKNLSTLKIIDRGDKQQRAQFRDKINLIEKSKLNYSNSIQNYPIFISSVLQSYNLNYSLLITQIEQNQF